MRRRTFLKTTMHATAAVAAGHVALVQKVRSQTPAGIRLGFDMYSLRAWKWKAIQFIDYAANLKLDSMQLSSLDDFESLDPLYLRKVKDHASSAGIVLDGGIGCICASTKSWNAKEGTPVAYLLKGIRVAKAVGATSMRCFMGSSADRLGPAPIESHIENTVKALKAVRSRALDAGVKIAVENHSGDMQARELKASIEEAGKDYTAACLDTGNPMWVAEDPMTALKVLAPTRLPRTSGILFYSSIREGQPRNGWRWARAPSTSADSSRASASCVRIPRCNLRTSRDVLHEWSLILSRNSGRRFRTLV